MRHFFTTRLDYNITYNHHFSLVYNYDKYDSTPDFLNNVVAAFPGTGIVLGIEHPDRPAEQPFRRHHLAALAVRLAGHQ